jgi:hypothetical protein
LKFFPLTLIFTSLLLILGCSKSDDTSSKNTLTVNGKVYDLSDVNFYFIEKVTVDWVEGFNDDYWKREFTITDGTFTKGNGSPDVLSNAYSGATFALYFSLATLLDQPFENDTYPVYYRLSYTPEGTNGAYVSFDPDDDYWIFPWDSETSFSNLHIKVFSDNQIQVTFKANLYNGADEPYFVNLNFKGSYINLDN